MSRKPIQQGLMGLLAVLMVAGMAYQFTPALNNGGSLFGPRHQGTPALKVNGQTITTQELEAVKRSNPMFSATDSGVLADDFKTVIVARAVQNKLYTEAAKDINVSRADVDAQVKKVREDNGLTDNKKWTDALQGVGLTDSSYRQQVREGLALQRKVEEIQKAAPAPTDAELKAYFDLHGDQYQNEARIVGRQIVLADKAKADALLKQVKAGGDFAALATANSTDANTKARGGALGPIENGSPRPVTKVILPTEVAAAAFALTNGGVTDVVSSGGKFFIVKVEKYLAPTPKTFEEAKTDVTSAVTQQKKDAALEAWTDGLQKNVQIDVVDPEWKTVDPNVASVAGQNIKYSEVLAQMVGNQQLAMVMQQMAPDQVVGLLNSSFKPELVKGLIQGYAAPTIAKNLGLNIVGSRQELASTLEAYAARDVKVTDADIQKFYAENQKSFETSASANVDEASFNNKNQAAAFRADWNGSGDFTSAASKAGATVSERGTITGGEQKLDPKLESAVFSGPLRSVGEGSLTDVVQVGNRYSVAYVSDLKKAAVQPLSAVRSQIEQQVLGSKKSEASKAFMSKQVDALKPVDNLKTVLADQAKRVAAAEKAAATSTGGTTTTAPATPNATPATPATK